MKKRLKNIGFGILACIVGALILGIIGFLIETYPIITTGVFVVGCSGIGLYHIGAIFTGD